MSLLWQRYDGQVAFRCTYCGKQSRWIDPYRKGVGDTRTAWWLVEYIRFADSLNWVFSIPCVRLDDRLARHRTPWDAWGEDTRDLLREGLAFCPDCRTKDQAVLLADETYKQHYPTAWDRLRTDISWWEPQLGCVVGDTWVDGRLRRFKEARKGNDFTQELILE